MPDYITTEAPPTKQDVLMQGTDGVKTNVIDRATSGAADDSDLGKVKEAGAKDTGAAERRKNNTPNLREDLTAVNNPPRFSERDLSDLRTALRGAVPDTRIDAAIDNLGNVVKYTEAALTAVETSQPIEDVIGNTEWSDVRDAVVKFVAEDGGLLEKYPELNEISDDAARKEFIENVVARDPRLHKIIVDKLRRTLDNAKTQLGLDSQAEELERLEKNHEVLDRRQEAQWRVFESSLQSAGLDQDQINSIKENVNAGVSIKSALLQVEGLLVDKKGIGIEHYNHIAEYASKTISADQFEGVLRTLRAEYATLSAAKGNNRNQNRINELTTEIARYEGAISTSKGQAEAIHASMIGTGLNEAAFTKKLFDFMAIKGLTTETSSLAAQLEEVQSNATLLKDATQAISDIKLNPDNVQRIEDRKKNKENLTRDIENLAANSVSEFLGKKYDDWEADQGIKLAADIKEAEEMGDAQKADALKSLQKKLNGLSMYDERTGKWVRNPKNIEPAMQGFAAEVALGNPGERRFIAQAAGFELNEEKRRNTTSAEVTGVAGKNYADLTPEEKTRVDQVLEQRKGRFDALVAEQGPTVKERLMEAYLREKNKVHLTADQLVLINKQMGDLIDQKLNESAEGKKALEDLRSKGIRPSAGLKTLLWLLLGLGGVVAGAGGLAAAAAISGAR